jgi:hypothetical protein
MALNINRLDERASAGQLHPRVYKLMLALVVVLIAGIWGFFLGGFGTGFVLVVASLFVIWAFALPYGLARISHHDEDSDSTRAHAPVGPEDASPYRDWARREITIGESRVRGRDATIEALLPIAAVALGMLAFAVIVHLIAGAG